MEKSLVSIGLLTYNHEKYIADMLESLLSQEYERMELIILDDASEDRTIAIIEQYKGSLGKKFERLIIIKNEKNEGNIPYNCNRIMRESSGEFYFEAAGDDVLLPTGICVLCKAMQEHPDCMVIHANMVQVQDDYSFGDKINVDNTIWGKRPDGMEAAHLFQRLMNGNCIAAPTVMLRRKVFDKCGYHDEMIAYEDYEYWLRLSRTEKFYFVNSLVALHRVAAESVTNFEEDNAFHKLRVAINADFQAKRKYIGELKPQEQRECWRTYFIHFYKICEQYHFQEGLNWLKERMEELGIEATECRISYKELFEKQKRDTQLLQKWLAVKDVPKVLGNYLRSESIFRVAIYGYLRLGVILQRELLQDGIEVDYVIDRKGSMLACPFPVYTLEEPLPKTDAIIVAPIGLYETIKPMLQEKTKIRILGLCQILEKVGTGNELAESI